VTYRPSPYPINHPNAAQMDQNRQSQPSPVQVKYEDRREMHPHQHHMYQNSRTPYYPEGSGQAIPQPQYSQQPQMGQWAGQSHGS